MIENGHDRDRETMIVDVGGAKSKKVIDLGRDTNLGFLELEIDVR